MKLASIIFLFGDYPWADEEWRGKVIVSKSFLGTHTTLEKEGCPTQTELSP